MGVINVKKFGFAVGITLAMIHLGCVGVMLFTSHEAMIAFFNSILHGIDVRPIMRMDMSTFEMVYGIFQIFAIGWLIGASIASIYNFSFINYDKK